MATLFRGVVLYKGPSRLDGGPIVVVATLKTANEKTGDMVQTWVLREDTHPLVALVEGTDRSVCGNCPLRNNGCYVRVEKAPAAVWRTYRAGQYPTFNPLHHLDLFRGRKLRMGSYGDPAAVPFAVWKPLLAVCSGHTGYTHQWRRSLAAPYRAVLMASVASDVERDEAQGKGWRTFRVRLEQQELHTTEIVCPASEEAGYRRQCASCLACDGAGTNAGRRSVAIIAHGGVAVKRHLVSLL
jgi:hypothetical protein